MRDFIGHEALINNFKQRCLKNTLSHAHLIAGEDGVGKGKLANILAKFILNGDLDREYVDIINYSSEKSSFGVDDVRDIIEEVYKKPFEKDKKVIIIHEGNKLTIQAQNALLKTIEEPPKGVYIIILCESLELILDTIKSRCEIYKLKPLTKSELYEYIKIKKFNYDENEIKSAIAFSEGVPGRIDRYFNDDKLRELRNNIVILIKNLNKNELETIIVNEAVKSNLKTQSSLFGSKDKETEERFKRVGIDTSNIPFVLNFERLLRSTKFTEAMRKILKVVSSKYNYPVDIEYTANFDKQGNFRINIVQCRPLQTRGLGKTVELPKLEDKNSCLFSSTGNFMGGNVRLAIDYIVFISSDDYVKLPEVEKYNIARQVGIINKELKGKNAMLMGPGRWGSSNPELGVPVKFTELCNMSVMCEIAYSNQDLMPELSYGSHFFQDLVETGIFYVALFDNREDVVFNENKLREKENIVKQIVKDANINDEVIKVYDTKGLQIYSDITQQIVTCS